MALLSSGERKRNFMVWDLVSMEGVAKQWHVLKPAPLGQEQSDVQGHCCIATASSSCTKTQDAYDELNWVDGEGSPCSGDCLQSLLLGWIPCPDELKTSSSITLPFDLPCCSFFSLGDDDLQVANCCYICRSYRKHHVTSPVVIWLRNVSSLLALLIRSPQVPLRSSCWSCIRMHGTLYWVTQDTFRSSGKISWQAP
jgi:hypothetical protein